MKTKKLHEAAYTCAAFTGAWRTFTTEKTVKNAQDLVAKGQAYLEIQKSTGTQMYSSQRANLIVWTAEDFLAKNSQPNGLVVEKGDVLPSYRNEQGHKVTVLKV